MNSFAYHRPATLEEASGLVMADQDGVFLAGGQTLIPTLKHGLAAPASLVDLKGIVGLSSIEKSGNSLVIGALARHAAVASSPDVAKCIPALAALAGNIGDPQVRNRGTLGGSVANNDPSADYPSAVLGLNATVETSKREIPADSFFVGMFETALEPGELIVSIAFPIPMRAAYMKFPNPASGYAMVGVFVAEAADGVRVAVTGAGPCVFRWTAAEAVLNGDFSAGVLKDVPLEADSFLSDMHGDAAYRASLVRVMTERAVNAAGGI